MYRSESTFLFGELAIKEQAPQKGAKKSVPVATKKIPQKVKEQPQVNKPLSDEEQIIRAAENYHQMLSGKKQEAPKENAAPVRSAPVPQKTLQQTRPSQIVQQPVKAAVVNPQTSLSTPVVNNTSGDPNANIFTGNPGIYSVEGDTLNFWSYTTLPQDTLPERVVETEQVIRPYGMPGKVIHHDGQDWTFFLILLGWSLFASLRFGYSKYIQQVFHSAFNFGVATRFYREQGYNNNFGLFRLNLIFYLFLPFPIYLIARDNGVAMMGSTGIELYLIILVVANAYFLLKIFLYKILGSIFSRKDTTGELVFNMMLYNNVMGVVLMTVGTLHALLPAFAPYSLFIGPGVIVFFYLFSLVKSIYFAIRESISIFYLILYLCALEILPVLLVVKIAIGN